jgi:fibronectin type 3 domain-containing protein
LKNVFHNSFYLENNMARIYAMEDLDENVEDVTTDDATAFVDSPEEEAVESTEAATEVEQGQGDIDQAAETALALDDVADRMEGSIEEGGMTEAGQAAVETAVEHMLAQIGVAAANRKPMPSCESFASGDRKHLTRVAVENLRAKA